MISLASSHGLSFLPENENANEPGQEIAIPSGLLSCFLLIPVGRRNVMERLDCRSRKASARGQDARQKRVAIPDWGR
jgi:hypothetical protein